MEPNFVEIEVVALIKLSDDDGAVLFQVRHAPRGTRPLRFLMGFGLDVLLFIKAARDDLHHHGLQIGHGSVMRFYEDHSDVRLDHVTVHAYDTENQRYLTACHGTTPEGEFSRNMLPSDAIAMALAGGVPFWMEELLLVQADERSRPNVDLLDARGAFRQSYDPFDDLEDIPDELLPPKS